jgi:hypothetical protein
VGGRTVMTPKSRLGDDSGVKELAEEPVGIPADVPRREACRGHLWRVRWPNVFACPQCGGVSAREEANWPLLWGCHGRGKHTSLIVAEALHLSSWLNTLARKQLVEAELEIAGDQRRRIVLQIS